MNDLSERYDLDMMAAYVRGSLKLKEDLLFTQPLSQLDEEDFLELLELARTAGLKLHYFKRYEALPRVKLVLGFLRAVQPESLLDVGTGRGAFLFPFLRQFPRVPVTALDVLEERVAMLSAIHDGGVEQLTAIRADLCDWAGPDHSYDVVTLLEVLEHIYDVEAAIRNALRLSRRYVVVTVPSKPDDNPEHIHLLTKQRLTEIFSGLGCARLQFGGVTGHLFMVASV